MISQINAYRSEPLPIKDADNQDESTHKNTGETDEKVQDLGPALDDDLDVDVDDIEIEENDHIFMMHSYSIRNEIMLLS
jgi:hypothetical protein